MNADSRARRADAVRALQKAHGQGLHTALIDLLEAEIAEAQEEMESADQNITIWRAQGRAAGARSLLAAITPRNAG
ncbi:hypothetical protein [Desulfovibrio sp. ZJ200]|uniref:hypothetical protein n=1 Tax=Desulfovibrio sp. ZJ200 TaxID=2709792 RepID=UPI0013ED710F|nr:hypothetical protein [Desulfovibrio sp. ZJ200]